MYLCLSFFPTVVGLLLVSSSSWEAAIRRGDFSIWLQEEPGVQLKPPIQTTNYFWKAGLSDGAFFM